MPFLERACPVSVSCNLRQAEKISIIIKRNNKYAITYLRLCVCRAIFISKDLCEQSLVHFSIAISIEPKKYNFFVAEKY